MSERAWYLGTDGSGDRFELPADDLTTHGVIVGMTGSGKTGLGIVMLEEALRSGVPVLALDPKGDLGNLLLTFPDLDPASFAPWVPPGTDPAEVARTWRDGLARSGLGPPDIAALRERAELAVLTPGSTAGTPINLVGSLRRPPADDAETRLDAAETFITGLLGLAGLQTDPLSDPEHVLGVNLLVHAWDRGVDLTLEGFIAGVLNPPFRRLGVFDIDTFMPPETRRSLAMRLNTLAASPAFRAWQQGVDPDPDQLLWAPDGRPVGAVVSLAHLSEAERQFAVAALLGRLVAWMRRQPGSEHLRVLVYIDEVVGLAPPTAQPPAKRPILTILKQARAFGIGMVLATQNPVDLDYKALSNAGVWMIGRLQTTRDRDRLLDGLGRPADLDETIAGLPKRTFVVRSTRRPTSVLSVRWAMSYLRGPLTLAEVGRLPAPSRGTGPVTGQRTDDPPATLGVDVSPVPPPVPERVPVRWIDPAAPWARDLGAVPDSPLHRPVVVATASMLFDERAAGLRHTVEWEAVWPDPGAEPDGAAFIPVDHDPRDLRTEPLSPRPLYVLGDAPLQSAAWWRSVEARLRDELEASCTLTLLRSSELGLWSRPGEGPEEFVQRCRRAAEAAADAELASLRDRFASRARRARSELERAELRLRNAAERVTDAGTDTLLGAGELLGAFLGGRRRSRGLARAVRGVHRRSERRRAAEHRLEEAELAVAQARAGLEELEAELAEAVAEITGRWEDAATRITEVEITLERSDIRISSLVLGWMPVPADAPA